MSSSLLTVKGLFSSGDTQPTWNLALPIYKSPVGFVKRQTIIPPSPCAPHENTHWLFVLMLGPNITIVSGSLPHSSLDGHLGEFVYNVCFE